MIRDRLIHFLQLLRPVLVWTGIVAGSLILITVLVLFVGPSSPADHISWGVNFSQKFASGLQVDWKAAYLAILEDLRPKHLKVLTAWDDIETEPGVRTFDSVDFQLGEARAHGADVVLVIGMKTGRWPECHLPGWAKSLTKEEQQGRVFALIEAFVTRYRTHPALAAWQVENEAMFPFGDCPWYDTAFLRREVALVKQFDPTHPVVVSDSGELSLWWKAATIGDIVGTTLYRTAWFHELDRALTYPLPPVFYGRKAWLVRELFGKPTWNVELQAEPWGRSLLYDLPLEEQQRLMTPKKFNDIISYARQTGLDTFYLWGSEWWYKMKTVNADPGMWDAARELFKNG
ncbi:MAG: hypothetical protein Q7S84_04435 [bacterium]|nr:hypothetical protein [bacterium]